jgi:allophanate hydrolase subunit 2
MGAGTTVNRGAITLGGETLTADSDGAISLTGSAITATADTSTITLNAATNLAVDAAADITLDAGGADIVFADDGTTVATFTNDGTDLSIVATGGDIRTTGNVDAATLEVGDASGTGEFVVDANGALTMTGASVGITVNNGSADTCTSYCGWICRPDLFGGW